MQVFFYDRCIDTCIAASKCCQMVVKTYPNKMSVSQQMLTYTVAKPCNTPPKIVLHLLVFPCSYLWFQKQSTPSQIRILFCGKLLLPLVLYFYGVSQHNWSPIFSVWPDQIYLVPQTEYVRNIYASTCANSVSLGPAP